MTAMMKNGVPAPLAGFVDLEPAAADFQADVLVGLARDQKTLEPKYFYDQVGARLFDEICRCEEYYITRTELALMDRIASELGARLGTGATVLEYGAGSGWKTRKLLGALQQPQAYVAVDISRDYLISSACELAELYPGISVTAVCGDFHDLAVLPDGVWRDGSRRVAYMPGSTIGNFDPDHARSFLVEARGHVGAGGAFLLGVDTKKPPERLHAAYNDADGVTAAFNRNVLHRMQRELSAEIEPELFDHYAFYNPRLGRIEMHLVAREATRIALHGNRFAFREGESVHTENSYKYSPDDVTGLARDAGWRVSTAWHDEDRLFGLYLLEV